MSNGERPPAVPAVPVDHYFQVRPLARHIHIMNQVMQWVDDEPAAREFYVKIYTAYSRILEAEFTSHAMVLALALAEIEEAFPEIAALVPAHVQK